MDKGEIPRCDWSGFFRTFVTKHRGRLCSLALHYGDEHMILKPLLLTAVGPVPGGDEGDEIRVVLDDWHGQQIAHIVRAPRHVFHSKMLEGIDETVEIDGAGGRTSMRFEAAN